MVVVQRSLLRPVLGVLVLLGFAGCRDTTRGVGRGQAEETESVRASLRAEHAVWERRLVRPPSTGGAFEGFRHRREQSKFVTGVDVQARYFLDGDEVRHVGSLGTFIEFANGFVMARPHANSPVATAGPLTNDAEAHHARVLSYFKGSGLPPEQIDNIGVTTDMEEVWDRAAEKLISRRFLGYTSVIGRNVAGVRVVGSRAWAQFNKNDEVVAEEVWWPELPSSLTEEVAAFRAATVNSSALSAFRAKLPAQLADANGVLEIHHSEPHDRSWYAVVTLDFAQEGGPLVVSLDRNGETVTFTPGGTPPHDEK